MSQPDRESILRRFAAWLDEALAREDAPQGIPVELLDAPAVPPDGDLYAVQAAVTVLAQEVKLQGRSFKQLSETVAPIAEMAPALSAAIEQARLQARREVLNVLLDLRDRLLRGEETACATAAAIAAPKRWWQRRKSPRAGEVVGALREGYALTLARLDEALATYGVSEIDCADRPFDPGEMHATGIEETDTAAEGTVVAVLRRGYEWNGEVYRPAEVRVARLPEKLKEQSDG
jgi:molecular chaperone GrpE